MTTTEPKCAECQFAEFTDYDTFKCLQHVDEHKRNECEKFAAIEPEKTPSSYIISGKLNEIIEEERAKTITLETEKQKTVHFVRIQSTEKSAPDELDNRIYTLAEIPTYSDTDLFRKTETLPAGKLIKYQREVIRNGKHLLLRREKDSKRYIAQNLSKLRMCEQCVTREHPVDIILMTHADFDSKFLTANCGKRKVEDQFKDAITSLIEYKDNNTVVRIIDKIEKDSKTISTFNILALKGELKDLQLGKVDPDTKFYISESAKSKNVKKIVLTDGTQAILISHPDAYKIISDPLWTIIYVLTTIVTIIIAISLITTILSETGYLVFWGFGLIVIGYIVIILVGAPIYLIVNKLRKYF